VRCVDRQGRHRVVSRTAKPDAAARIFRQRHARLDDSGRQPSLARNHGLHMTLATKNGSLIVKDGKIAENCGCCGGDGWYCYNPACPQTPVVLTISNYLSQSQTPATPLAGTRTLSPVAGTCTRWDFSDDRGEKQCRTGFSPFDRHGIFITFVRSVLVPNTYILSVYSYDDTTCQGVIGQVTATPADAYGCPTLPATGTASLAEGNTSFSWSLAYQA
jgi:hypothetical protein